MLNTVVMVAAVTAEDEVGVEVMEADVAMEVAMEAVAGTEGAMAVGMEAVEATADIAANRQLLIASRCKP